MLIDHKLFPIESVDWFKKVAKYLNWKQAQ